MIHYFILKKNPIFLRTLFSFKNFHAMCRQQPFLPCKIELNISPTVKRKIIPTVKGKNKYLESKLCFPCQIKIIITSPLDTKKWCTLSFLPQRIYNNTSTKQTYRQLICIFVFFLSSHGTDTLLYFIFFILPIFYTYLFVLCIVICLCNHDHLFCLN